MNLGILASLIIFSLTLSILIKRQSSKQQKIDRDYWDRERRANLTSRKSLDNLKYINIPLERFATHLLSEDDNVREYIETLSDLTSQKIVNFTGFTNTDLKMAYGAGNLPFLSECDHNYTIMVRTLQKWANALIKAGFANEACAIMEFAVSTGTDITATYEALAEFYFDQKRYSDIDNLISMANNLKSANKKIIVKHLSDKYPQL